MADGGKCPVRAQAAGANVMTWADAVYWMPLAALVGCGAAAWWLEKRHVDLRRQLAQLDSKREEIDVRVAIMDQRARDFSRAINYAGIGLREEAVSLLKRWEAPEDAS